MFTIMFITMMHFLFTGSGILNNPLVSKIGSMTLAGFLKPADIVGEVLVILSTIFGFTYSFLDNVDSFLNYVFSPDFLPVILLIVILLFLVGFLHLNLILVIVFLLIIYAVNWFMMKRQYDNQVPSDVDNV